MAQERFHIYPNNNQALNYKLIINQYLSKEEIKRLHRKSDLKGWWEVISIWAWIVFAFILVAITPHITSNRIILALTILIALFILGGKQLGCAIIMHDASHYSLFKSKKLNDLVGNILGAYPIFNNIKQYRPYHFQHHLATGTMDDPDINLVKGYPAKLASMLRKLARDLIGLTGIKADVGLLSMHLGLLRYNLGNKVEKVPADERPWKVIFQNAYMHLKGPFLFNVLFFLLLWLLNQPLLYVLWLLANLTTFNFCLRIRSIAEHSVVEDTNNPYKNTRTTYANFFERILFAPLYVNYHLEHHFLQNMPSYNAPELHQLLLVRGFYKKALLKKGYWDIIKMAIRN